MIRSFLLAACAGVLLFFSAAAAWAESAWDNVARVVVIGDLEGDADKFEAIVRDAGLVDARGNWAGGRAHLVQLGDIPDRGAHSRRIMDQLMRLERQAARAGGRVHALIGNHEAMNVEGDLRYVDPGEYAAFVDRNSPRRRADYYARTLEHLRAHPPEAGLPAFDEAFRAAWEARYPLGYVEHRLAWAPGGAYGGWVARHNAVIRINDTLFVHGGLGPSYTPYEREAMNDAVRSALRGESEAGSALADILTNQEGPLWYRGLSVNDEALESAHLDALLARHGVARIVVGHTKLSPWVQPRFAGRVLVADVDFRTPAGDPRSYLVIEGGAVTAVHRGARVPVTAATLDESCAYLRRIWALDPVDSTRPDLRAACASAQ